MKSFTRCAVVLLVGVAAARADDGKLTPERAKKLLPEAASVPNKDLEALGEGKKLPKTNQSPTYFVLTFTLKPDEKLPEGAAKDFDWTMRTMRTINPAALADALRVSKDR